MMRKFSYLIISLLIMPLPVQAKRAPVTVAVVDMGIDYWKFPELLPFMKTNPHFDRGWDFGINESSNGVDYSYKYSGDFHGTLIAYLISRPDIKSTKKPINLLDVVYSDYQGNLFNLNRYMFPENNLQVYRKKRALHQFSEHISETFNYATLTGAQVINFSSGDRGFDSEKLKDWILEASKKNVFVVVSAGNDGDNLDEFPQYPCSYNLPNLICVGATTKKYRKATYSNFGTPVQIYALGNHGGKIMGTSFAAPLVSRALALIKYHHPNWSIRQVRQELFRYVAPVNHLPVFNHKLFNRQYAQK